MNKKKSFEESVKELENIVGMLESGDTSLDESLKYFEKGVTLVKNCQNMLDSAQKRVFIITENNSGELTEEKFTADNEM